MTPLAVLLGSALAHHPHDPVDALDLTVGADGRLHLYASRVPNQTWRPPELVFSDDAGLVWAAAGIGIADTDHITDLSLSEAFVDDGIGVVTTLGEAFVTTSGTHQWTRIAEGRFRSGVVARVDGAPVIVLGTDDGEVWVSADLGQSWARTAMGASPVRRLTALGPRVAYVDDDAVVSAPDGGRSWTRRPVADPTDVALARGAMYWSGAEGVFRQEGAEIAPLPALPLRTAGLGVAPADSDHPLVFAAHATRARVYVTADGGETARFSGLGRPHSDQHETHFRDLRFSPRFEEDGTAYVATFEGLYETKDRGESWRIVQTRPPALITGIGVSNRFAEDGLVLLSTYDAGTYLSEDGGDTFRPFSVGLMREATYGAAIHHGDDGAPVVFAGARNHLVRAEAPFERWTQMPLMSDDRRYPAALAISQSFDEDQTILVGTRFPGTLSYTDDGADTWSTPGTTGGGVASVSWGTNGISALAGTRKGHLWYAAVAAYRFRHRVSCIGKTPAFVTGWGDGWFFGCADGGFTTDGTDRTPIAELTEPVNQVAAAPDGTRFAVERGGALLRSDASGPFTPVGAELLAHGVVFHELVASPTFAEDHTVFGSAGSDLYRSTDRGDTWAHVGPTPVRHEDGSYTIVYSGEAEAAIPEPAASAGGYTVLGAGGAAELVFEGTGATWIGGPGHGVAAVEVDGQPAALVDTDAAPLGTPRYAVHGLPMGRHKLRISVISGAVTLDAIEVERDLRFLPGASGDTEPSGHGGAMAGEGTDCSSTGAALHPWWIAALGLWARRR